MNEFKLLIIHCGC